MDNRMRQVNIEGMNYFKAFFNLAPTKGLDSIPCIKSSIS